MGCKVGSLSGTMGGC